MSFRLRIETTQLQTGKSDAMQGRHPQYRNILVFRRLLVSGLSVAAFLIVCANAWATFEEGVTAYRAGDYDRARYEWLPVAAENDERALFNLGQMYRLGKGVEINMYVAEQYYRRAAAQGHVQAMGSLGSIHFSKKPPMIEDALYYWRQAALAGDGRSRLNLGVEYFNGDHLPRDNALAYAWITLASQAGLTEADEVLKVLGQYLSDAEIAEGKRLVTTLIREPARQVADAKSSPRPSPQPAEPSPASPATSAPAFESPVSEEKPETKPVTPATPDIVVDARDPASTAPLPAPITKAASKPVPKPAPVAQPALAEPVEETEQIRVPVIQASRAWPASEQGSETKLASDQEWAGEIFRVQLALLRSREAAERQKARLNNMRSAILADMALIVDELNLGAERGQYFRVISEPLESADAAAALCDRLRALDVSCTQLRTIQIVSTVNDEEMDLRSVLPVLDEVLDEVPDKASSENASAIVGSNAPETAANVAVNNIPVPRDKPPAPQPVQQQVNPFASRQVLQAPPGHAESVPDNYRVQIASLRSDREAREKWRSLSARYATIMAGVQVYFDRAEINGRGIYHRVQLGPFATRKKADEFCTKLKQLGNDCFVLANP